MTAELVESLRFMVFNGRCVRSDLKPAYLLAFRFWHRLWSETYREIGKTDQLTSDQFMRNAEIGCLFRDGQPIGIMLYDWFDLSDDVHLSHSYFAPHSPNVLAKYGDRGVTNAMVWSNFIVDNEYRGRNATVPVADLIMGLSVKRFEATQFQHAIAYARNQRKVHELGHRYGCVSVVENEMAWNEPTDFTLFTRSSIDIAALSPFAGAIERIWFTRIHERPTLQLFQQYNRIPGELSNERTHREISV